MNAFWKMICLIIIIYWFSFVSQIISYQFSATIGFMLATAWCLVICFSRIYLGMHSVADVVAGLLLTIVLMIPLVPIFNRLDYYILSADVRSPLLVIAISILLIVYYPRSDKWTPTRSVIIMNSKCDDSWRIIKFHFG